MRVLLLLALAVPLVAQKPVVTDTKLVDYHKSKMLLRKINGRWWTDDDRQVYPPGKGGFWWEIDSKPGVCVFHHHRPFDVSRGESLRLWMTPDEVERMFGEPNRELGGRGQGFWYYYGADGTALVIRFMEGELGEADYDKDVKKRPVESIARELGGRSIYRLKAERASERLKEQQELRRSQRDTALPQAGSSARAPRSSMTVVRAGPAAAEPTPTPTFISAEALAQVKRGASREDVIRILGKPGARMAIATADSVDEDFEYQLQDGRKVTIGLVDGKVTRLP